MAAPFVYPPALKTTLLEKLRATHATFLEHEPHRDDVLFFKWLGLMFHHWWLDNVMIAPARPHGTWN